MYKVFLKDKVVVIAQSDEKNYRSQLRLVFDFVGADQLKIVIDSFTRQGNNDEMMISCDDPGKVFENFCSYFELEEAAGGLVINDGRILMIYRRNHWDLPKGKGKHGEEYLETARREILEETRIGKLSYVKDLSQTYHLFQRDGKWILKICRWYLFRTKDESIPSPEYEEDITDVQWISKEELPLVFGNLYDSLYDIVLEALCKIE